MSQFQPELGQWGFSNTPWGEFEVPDLAHAALNMIRDEISRVDWNETQEINPSPFEQGGEAYTCSSFTVRPYCWCDGRTHPEGCPPNFTWRNVTISWYKHAGRSMSSNVDLTPDMISEMLNDCLKCLRDADNERYHAMLGDG